jgi:hypothetical protein
MNIFAHFETRFHAAAQALKDAGILPAQAIPQRCLSLTHSVRWLILFHFPATRTKAHISRFLHAIRDKPVAES